MRIGINGFGRIGRLVLKVGLKQKDLSFVGINDLTDPKTLAHLFKYDSTFGVYPGSVSYTDDSIVIDGQKIKIFSERNPACIPWDTLGIEIVVESTGFFTHARQAGLHLKKSVKKVVISAPAKEEDITVCMGINHEKYDPLQHSIISNASCTTNCLAPLVKVLNDEFKIVRGLMTTIHSYTNDQVTLDGPHKDLRRSRTAAESMIPTTTGAAKAIGLVIPEMIGRLNGLSVRVPTKNVSLVDLTVELQKGVSIERINQLFKQYADTSLKGYLRYVDEPLVSKDFNGDAHSCIFDSLITDVSSNNLVKVFGWYDNEFGYSSRVVDLVSFIQSRWV